MNVTVNTDILLLNFWIKLVNVYICEGAKSSTEVAGAREKTEFATGRARKSHFRGSSSQTVPLAKKMSNKSFVGQTRSIVCRRQDSDVVHNKVDKRR